MSEIPGREQLESMSRMDIQKLCKNNNIKANMKTEQMINALCDRASGKEAPSNSGEKVVSTDDGGALNASTLVPPPINDTRRRAKKGQPAAARRTGARNITHTKGKADAMLEEPVIVEQDGFSSQAALPTAVTVAKEDLTSSVRPVSPRPSHPHPPAPALSLPALPTVQFNALEARVQDLESQKLDMVAGITGLRSQMEALVKNLIQENTLLKTRVNELERWVQDHGKGSLETHILQPSSQSHERALGGSGGHKNGTPTVPPRDVIHTPKTRRRLNDELPDPSPSQSTLGKRPRGDTPDASLDEISTPLDPDSDAIERKRPPHKRPRLDHDEDEDVRPFPVQWAATAPVTLTPKSTLYSCLGMGRPEGSTAAQGDIKVTSQKQTALPSVDPRDPSFFAHPPIFNFDSRPSNFKSRPISALPYPIQRSTTPGPVTSTDPAPLTTPHFGKPLLPKTPVTSIDPAPLTMPHLDEPRSPETITTYNQGSEGASNTHRPREASGSNKFHPYSSGHRPSGSRSPGPSHGRGTGLRPRSVSTSLKSPAPLPTVPELSETGLSEDSPPTELPDTTPFYW